MLHYLVSPGSTGSKFKSRSWSRPLSLDRHYPLLRMSIACRFALYNGFFQ